MEPTQTITTLDDGVIQDLAGNSSGASEDGSPAPFVITAILAAAVAFMFPDLLGSAEGLVKFASGIGGFNRICNHRWRRWRQWKAARFYHRAFMMRVKDKDGGRVDPIIVEAARLECDRAGLHKRFVASYNHNPGGNTTSIRSWQRHRSLQELRWTAAVGGPPTRWQKLLGEKNPVEVQRKLIEKARKHKSYDTGDSDE